LALALPPSLVHR